MIDFHSHLDLYPDPLSVAKECSARRIYLLSVTTTPSAWRGTSALALPGSRIRTALGLHPQLAHERKSELGLFDAYLPETNYVGEIGLDGSPQFKPHWEDQMAVFNHILQGCSRVGGRILSIHSRRATSSVLTCLEKFTGAGIPVLHWFSGSKRELERAIARECWFSVGPAMLSYARSRDLVAMMPQSRLLTESDGPFAQLDGHNAMPWDVQRAEDLLAAVWKTGTDAVTQQLENNLRRLVTLL